MFSLLPWKQADCVYDLTGAGLAGVGIRFLMADLDNTLCRYSESQPSPRLRTWLEDLNAHGVTLFLLSNSRKSRRAPDFAQNLGIGWLAHAGKPKTGGFEKAMADNGFLPEESAIVGDQIFTDTLGGNRAGVRSILVKPIDLSGNPGRYLRYWVELPVRLMSRGRRWEKEGDT